MERTSLSTVGRVGDEASKSEVLVAGNSEVLDGEVEEVLLGAALALVHHLVDGLRDVERQVDEDAVSRTLDLVVPEQHVGLEEADRLIDDVGLVCKIVLCSAKLMIEPYVTSRTRCIGFHTAASNTTWPN